MARCHPLAADEDVSIEELATAQAKCALMLGRLEGKLAALTALESQLFAWSLLRHVAIAALRQAGFTDAEMRFDFWFAGASRGPEENPNTAFSAAALIRALLGTLANHRWPPLAHAAATVDRVGRFAADRPSAHEQPILAEVINNAALLAARAAQPPSGLPFAALTRLVELARQHVVFSPGEAALENTTIAYRHSVVERPAPKAPLWALDLQIGTLLAQSGIAGPPLPCPNAILTSALQPQRWPRERSVAVFYGVRDGVSQLLELLDVSRRRAKLMAVRFATLRASSRAPLVWGAVIGFGPMGPEQISRAFGMSRRGTYSVVDALIEREMALRTRERGMVLLRGLDPARAERPEQTNPRLETPSPALADFTDAMDNLDRLLARLSCSAEDQACGAPDTPRGET